MLRFVIALSLLPCLAWAQEWKPMTGAEIGAALTDQNVTYANARQRFYASGRTLYSAGQDSWGYWAVRGDQYCSQWPPGDAWDCYDVAAADGMVRFIGADNSTTDGTFAK